MLIVNHYVSKSNIEGCGLFCSEDVKKGDIIFRYDYRFVMLISDSEIASLPAAMQAAVLKYSYRGVGKDRLVGAVYYCIDDSRFMNHSEHPNTLWIESDEIYVASCDIPKNSELTCNYSDFCESGEFCFEF